MVLAVFCLIVAMGFTALCIDTGHITLKKTIMQNAVDSAALAAAMEIVNGIENAPPEATDPTAYAREVAIVIAADTADLNGVFVDPNIDVEFGLRNWNPATEKFEITWGVEPANAVKVKARMDNDDSTQPDAKLPLFFAGVLGDQTTQMYAEAVAFIESRDIAVVLDFSNSMRYDSLLRSDTLNKLGQPAVEGNLNEIYEELKPDLETTWPGEMTFTPEWLIVDSPPPGGPSDPTSQVTFKYDDAEVSSDLAYNRVRLTFTNGLTENFYVNESSGTYSGTGSNSGKNISTVHVRYPGPNGNFQIPFSDSNSNVQEQFALDGLAYPFPSGNWNEYIDYVRSSSNINRGGFREMYGGLTFAHFLLDKKNRHWQTPQLAQTPHYPFHAIREGNRLFNDFLEVLGFSDHVGLVSYDELRRIEDTLDEDGHYLNLSSQPIGEYYDEMQLIMDYKQAGHYDIYTNIGGGIRQAHDALNDHGRDGARPTIFLMTDGNANIYEDEAGNVLNGTFWELPPDWDWSELQYDDGTAFSVESPTGADSAWTWQVYKARLFALKMAKRAADEGVTVHTLAVGAGADRDLMRAIAHLGDGEFIAVDGNLSVADLIEEVEAGFFRIAALVPPAQLSHE